MKQLDILIDGQSIDYFEGTNLSFTYAITSVRDFTTPTGSRSVRSISVPATKRNKRILQNSIKALPCSIYVNGLVVFQGMAQKTERIEGGTPYGLKDKTYKISFFGNNSSWVVLLQNKKFGDDLDWSDVSHVWEFNNVREGLFNTSVDTQDYCYCIIKRRPWIGQVYVHPSECYPSFYIAPLLKRIFKSVGYTVQSDFFNSDFAKTLIWPLILPTKYNRQYAKDFLNARAIVPPGFPVTADFQEEGDRQYAAFVRNTQAPAIGDNPYNPFNSNYNLASTYTIPTEGFYNIEASLTLSQLTFQAPPGENLQEININFVIEHTRNGTEIQRYSETFNFRENISPRIFVEQTFRCFTGEQLAIFLEFGEDNNEDIQYFFEFDEGFFQIIGEAVIRMGVLLRFEYLFRDLKLTDFIKGLQHLFNLKFDTDAAARVVRIEPENQGFFKGRNADFTERVDLSKKGTIRLNTEVPEEYIFEYKEPEHDPTQEIVTGNDARPLFSVDYKLQPNVFQPRTKKEINPFFSTVFAFLDRDIKASTSNIVPQVPVLYNSNFFNYVAEPFEDTSPIILIKPDPTTRTADDGLIVFYNENIYFDLDFASKLIVRPNPVAFVVNYNDPTGQEFNLSFSDVVVNDKVKKGLFARFYLKKYARLNKAIQFQCHMKFSALDIANLDFSCKVTIDENRYILRQVEGWSPLNNKTVRTTLVLDILPSQDDFDRIKNIEQSGLLNFITESEFDFETFEDPQGGLLGGGGLL